MSCKRASILFLSAVLGGCASSYEVVQLPEREADLYPLSQTKAGVTIAVDEIGTSGRAKRYFGADLIKEGILPVTVLVSNYGENRVIVKPSDVLLHRGKEVVDPLPVETVIAMAKSQRWFLRSKTEKRIDDFFEGLVFKETPLLPDESYQGVMFFPAPKPRRSEDAYFTALSLFREGGPRIRVGVTDMETRDRLHFGPFSLTPPE